MVQTIENLVGLPGVKIGKTILSEGYLLAMTNQTKATMGKSRDRIYQDEESGWNDKRDTNGNLPRFG